LLVLLTLVGAMAAWVKIPGPYQSQSQVVFLASQQVSKPNGNNPYLSFEGTLDTTADIVRREVMDPRVAATLADRGFKDTYDVENDPLGVGGCPDIHGPHRAGVMATRRAVTADVQANTLQLVQPSFPNPDTSMVVTNTPSPLLVRQKARPVERCWLSVFILILAIPDGGRGARRGRKPPPGGRRPWAPSDATPALRRPATGSGRPATPTGQRTETKMARWRRRPRTVMG
jgi:hypothetical protein